VIAIDPGAFKIKGQHLVVEPPAVHGPKCSTGL
jgi:hypothetical protein